MAFVEQSLRAYLPPKPRFCWGSDIQVIQRGRALLVRGRLPSAGDRTKREDVLQRYLEWLSDWSGDKKPSPPVWFANANCNEKLIRFVEEFGPVVASTVDEQLEKRLIWARQDLTTLRRERDLYACCLNLVRELRKGENEADLQIIRDALVTIVSATQHWPSQWRREARWMKSHAPDEPISWKFHPKTWNTLVSLQTDAQANFGGGLYPGRSTYLCGHQAICHILNSFRSGTQYVSGKVFEGPRTFMPFGIRPVLFFVLKQEYLRQGGLSRCTNPNCNAWFVVERHGQGYCSPDCSRRHRQRDYWQARGSARRRKRLKSRRKNRSKAVQEHRLGANHVAYTEATMAIGAARCFN